MVLTVTYPIVVHQIDGGHDSCRHKVWGLRAGLGLRAEQMFLSRIAAVPCGAQSAENCMLNSLQSGFGNYAARFWKHDLARRAFSCLWVYALCNHIALGNLQLAHRWSSKPLVFCLVPHSQMVKRANKVACARCCWSKTLIPAELFAIVLGRRLASACKRRAGFTDRLAN